MKAPWKKHFIDYGRVVSFPVNILDNILKTLIGFAKTEFETDQVFEVFSTWEKIGEDARLTYFRAKDILIYKLSETYIEIEVLL